MLTHTASRNSVWEPNIDTKVAECEKKGPVAVGLSDNCEDVKKALLWYRASAHSKESFLKHLDAIEKARVVEMNIVKVPFLGIEFDINDLGAFSAIGLSVIGIILAYSMVRYHENLYLCLWKIRRVSEREGRPRNRLGGVSSKTPLGCQPQQWNCTRDAREVIPLVSNCGGFF